MNAQFSNCIILYACCASPSLHLNHTENTFHLGICQAHKGGFFKKYEALVTLYIPCSFSEYIVVEGVAMH